MTELRIVHAGLHALTLLCDIRENLVRDFAEDVQAFLQDDYESLNVSASESNTHYFIGFADNSPFGYLRVSHDESAAEIKGPFLYPDYRSSELSSRLIAHALSVIARLRVPLVYSLVPAQDIGTAEDYAHAQFEYISDDIEFLKRWHDGIVADRSIPNGVRLFVRLLDGVEV
jgi:GNAT superfamily N-acetyltransferase